MKTCFRCETEKDTDAFGGNRSRPDGLSSYCKPCNKQYKKDYHEKNSEKHSMNSKKWRESHKEEKKEMDRIWVENNRDKSNLTKKQWKINHKSQNSGINKLYYQKNADAINTYNSQWAKNNPGKRRLTEHRRRTRKFGGGVFHVSDKDLKTLLSRPCFYCGEESKHIDHIVPLSRGGRHSIGNLIQACASCNLSKGNKFITEWRSLV